MNDALTVSTTSTEVGPVHFINIEYVFRLLYDLLFGWEGSVSVSGGSGVASFLATLWIWVNIIGYLIAIAAIGLVVYCVVRLYELREREKAMYGPLPQPAADDSPQHARWKHIQSLMASPNPNDWRQAIIEADILLGDVLTRQGYHAVSIGEQLKQIEPSDMDTLNDAWEAHKVRNEIAHQGSAYPLSELIARRTIARYENVFREFMLV
jgi:hypothetical protein